MNTCRVSLIGLGYIGLPTAALIASKKIDVIGVDINKNVVETINQGEIHIIENDLAALVQQVVNQGYLKAAKTPEEADVYVIAVPTPFEKDNKPDISYVKEACASIAPLLKQGDLVILESTSPVGTTENMLQWLETMRPDLTFPTVDSMGDDVDVHLAYCPERVLPGKVLKELVSNDRIIGGISQQCSIKSQSFYKQFVEGECLITNSRTAELAKLTENSFRDVNIAFANELSMVCGKMNINVWELIDLANRHPRVNILQPGCGVGGHCIAVDPWFIVDGAPDESKLIKEARQVNNSKPVWILEQVKNQLTSILLADPERKLSDLTISCFGAAFKPNIDDLRESPALKIIETLAQEYPHIQIKIVEPNVNKLPEKHSISTRENVSLVPLIEGLESDVLLALVAHDEFKDEPLLNQTALNFAWNTHQ